MSGSAGAEDRDLVARDRDFYRRLLELGSCPQIGPLLDDALALAVETTGADVGYLEMFGASDETTWWRAFGVRDGMLEGLRSTISRSIIAKSVADVATVETASALDDARFSDLGSVRASAIRAVVCVPIVLEGGPPLGALYLQRSERAGPFAAADRDRLELFARQLAPLADRLVESHRAHEGFDYTAEVRARFHAEGIVGRSQALAHVLAQSALVAPLDVGVLITGASGTGKSALARSIVANSRRATAPLVSLNCAALPDALLESELFGAERGAHSTATRRQPGKVAAAEHGTLFLDEVAELSLSAQAKLLHLLQERQYFPLGATTPLTADVRIIAATNADLKARVEAKTFREDLFYRLQVIPIRIPSLAERRADIELLAEHLVREAAARHGFAAIGLSRAALRACRDAEWPGNVRELAHTLEAAIIRAHGEGAAAVAPSHVFPGTAPEVPPASATFQDATRRFQIDLVRASLEATDWNVAETARRLDIARSHVYTLIQQGRLQRRG